ncbi:MAG: 3-acetyloctanal aminotransferase, partial [Mycobacterium sp.]|nr:3-acetyloctanal aminotransferase [Mycobacterium sp.]
MTFHEFVEQHLHSSTHLSKRHVHPKLIQMFELAGMDAVFTRGSGAYLWTEDGRRYLDLLSGGGVHFIGRNHPKVREALRDVLDMDLPNLSVANASVLGGLVADRLLALAGPPFEKVVFANSGTEATEICVRFTRQATGRRRYLYLDGAFHGRTYAAISLCGFDEMKITADPLMPTCTPVPRNDIDALRRELAYGDVAAFVVEAVQGMTCEVVAAEYLREAEKLCAQHGTVLVMDEVQTGLGRLGHWFGCHGAGVQPGMLTVSKTLSGGQAPVSAVLLTQDIYDRVFKAFKSGPIYISTFAENNLAMAAGLATLDILDSVDAPNRARALSDMFRTGLQDLADRYDVIDRITGQGLIIGVVFKSSADHLALRVQQTLMGAADAGAFAAAVHIDLHRRGILVQIPGFNLNMIKLLPPVILEDEDVRWFLRAFEEVLASYRRPTSGPVVAMAGGVARHALKEARTRLEVRRLAPARSPKATGTARVQEHSDYERAVSLDCDVCVVGSGPAGTVLAHRLATEGLDVVVLEAGAAMGQRDRGVEAGETFARWFWEGGMRTTRGNVVVPTLQARCLGGGSVVNSGICMRAPDFVFEKWATEDGVDGVTPGEMARHYDAVERFMGVRPVQAEVQGRRNDLFRAGAEAIGYQVEPLRRNEHNCRGSGQCIVGCPSGAKQSMDRRGVPELLQAGGRVYTSVHVDRLLQQGNRVSGVRGVVVDPATGRRTHRVRVASKCTVLAAGAFASPQILQRSGHTANPVGRNVRMHPGVIVTGAFDEEISPWNGATQGYHVTGFLEEGIKLESIWATPSIFGMNQPGVGEEFVRSLADYAHVATWTVWVNGQDSVGRVRARPGGTARLRYDLGAG